MCMRCGCMGLNTPCMLIASLRVRKLRNQISHPFPSAAGTSSLTRLGARRRTGWQVRAAAAAQSYAAAPAAAEQQLASAECGACWASLNCEGCAHQSMHLPTSTHLLWLYCRLQARPSTMPLTRLTGLRCLRSTSGEYLFDCFCVFRKELLVALRAGGV